MTEKLRCILGVTDPLWTDDEKILLSDMSCQSKLCNVIHGKFYTCIPLNLIKNFLSNHEDSSEKSSNYERYWHPVEKSAFYKEF